MKAQIRKALREAYGEFKTNLEHEYENVIVKELSVESFESKRKWATYNQVILELKHNLRDELRVKELQYWLTDNKNPNTVCMSVMESVKEMTPEMKRLYDKISNFL